MEWHSVFMDTRLRVVSMGLTLSVIVDVLMSWKVFEESWKIEWIVNSVD